MGRRTYTIPFLTCVCIYFECQGVSCLDERYPILYPGHNEGQSRCGRSGIEGKVDETDRCQYQIQPHVILSGTFSGRHTKGGEAAYSQYVRHLEKTSPYIKAANTTGTVENFAHGYQDYLQKPLQVGVSSMSKKRRH